MCASIAARGPSARSRTISALPDHRLADHRLARACLLSAGCDHRIRSADSGERRDPRRDPLACAVRLVTRSYGEPLSARFVNVNSFGLEPEPGLFPTRRSSTLRRPDQAHPPSAPRLAHCAQRVASSSSCCSWLTAGKPFHVETSIDVARDLPYRCDGHHKICDCRSSLLAGGSITRNLRPPRCPR